MSLANRMIMDDILRAAAEQLDYTPVPLSNEHFAAFCAAMVGQPYWYGTCLYPCTESRLTAKTKQYPSHYTTGRLSTYRKHIAEKKVCADCIGGAKGYAWTNGGVGVLEAIGTGKAFANSYASNNCPDKSANGMFSYAKAKGMEWGGIASLPNEKGIALHMDGHVGYTVGGGYAVEWRGFKYGCVKTKISGRGWKYWYRLPFIQYGPSAEPAPEKEYTLGSRLLKRGMTGPDVKAMQEMLIQLGYDLGEPGADGDFGKITLQRLMEFQQTAGLEIDGKYGSLTHAALMDAVADDDVGTSGDAPEPDPAPETQQGKRVRIVSEGGKVNIRVGNDATYSRITSVAPGTVLEYVATAANGWHAVVVNGQVGWVSGNFSKLEG